MYISLWCGEGWVPGEQWGNVGWAGALARQDVVMFLDEDRDVFWHWVGWVIHRVKDGVALLSFRKLLISGHAGLSCPPPHVTIQLWHWLLPSFPIFLIPIWVRMGENTGKNILPYSSHLLNGPFHLVLLSHRLYVLSVPVRTSWLLSFFKSFLKNYVKRVIHEK